MSAAEATRSSEAVSFLRAIIPEVCSGWRIEIRAKARDGKVRQHFTRSAAEAATVGEVLSTENDVWFGIGPRSRQRGTKQDVAAIGAAWADVDFKVFADGSDGATRVLEAFPIKPSIVVASGGGLQPYWLLNEAVTADSFARVERVNRGLAIALAPQGQHLDAVGDVSRVFRLPGTRNFKYDPPRPVEIRAWQPEWRVGITDLEDVVPLEVKRPFRTVCRTGDVISEGERNNHLASLGGSMRRRGMTVEEIGAALEVVNASRCQPPLPEREVLAIARSVARYQPAPIPTLLERQAHALARRFRS